MRDRMEDFAKGVMSMVDDILEKKKPKPSEIPPFALIRSRANDQHPMSGVYYVTMEPGVNVFHTEAEELQEILDNANAECVAVVYTGTRLEVEDDEEMEAVRQSGDVPTIMSQFGESCIGVFFMSADYVMYTTKKYESYDDSSEWDAADLMTITTAKQSGMTMPPFTVRR